MGAFGVARDGLGAEQLGAVRGSWCSGGCSYQAVGRHRPGSQPASHLDRHWLSRWASVAVPQRCGNCGRCVQAGHAVHEDEPERVAEAIAHFIKRFRVGEPPLKIPRPVPGLAPVLPVAMGPASGAVLPPYASLRRLGGEPGQ